MNWLLKPSFYAFFGPFGTEKDVFLCIKDYVLIAPACGSGSLLLKAAKILGKENVRQGSSVRRST